MNACRAGCRCRIFRFVPLVESCGEFRVPVLVAHESGHAVSSPFGVLVAEIPRCVGAEVMVRSEQFAVAEDYPSVVVEVVGLAGRVETLLVRKASYEVRMVRRLEGLCLGSVVADAERALDGECVPEPPCQVYLIREREVICRVGIGDIEQGQRIVYGLSRNVDVFEQQRYRPVRIPFAVVWVGVRELAE